MKALMTKSLLFSIIFSSSIVILVFILMDIFIFNNYSINTIIQAVVVGPVIGIVNHLILKNRVKQRWLYERVYDDTIQGGKQKNWNHSE